jgi:hypothetical protein
VARFIGGPLRGQHYSAAEAEAVAEAFDATYAPDHYVKGADGNYTFSTLIGSDVPPSGPLAPGAHRGWTFMQQQVNRRLPTALARSQAYRRAARRTLARHRRIR